MEQTEQGWIALLDERQRKEVKFDRLYGQQNFRHGTDGHNARLIIAYLADMLDRVEAAGTDVQKLYYPQVDGD